MFFTASLQPQHRNEQRLKGSIPFDMSSLTMPVRERAYAPPRFFSPFSHSSIAEAAALLLREAQHSLAAQYALTAVSFPLLSEEKRGTQRSKADWAISSAPTKKRVHETSCRQKKSISKAILSFPQGAVNIAILPRIACVQEIPFGDIFLPPPASAFSAKKKGRNRLCRSAHPPNAMQQEHRALVESVRLLSVSGTSYRFA